MVERILTQILYLLIVFPICYFSFRNKSEEVFKTFGIFCIYFISIQIALFLPLNFGKLNFLGGNLNWSEKVYSIIISVLFLWFYKKYSIKKYYIRLKQNKSFVFKSILIVLGLILIAIFLSINAKPINFNLERLAFQLTMPGLDEELAYRGIMLGLLSQMFIPTFKIGKYVKINSAILVTSILFGLIHSLYITENYTIVFNSYPFIITFFFGLISGYLAHKTKSVLFPIIGHNLYNTTIQVFKMFIN